VRFLGLLLAPGVGKGSCSSAFGDAFAETAVEVRALRSRNIAAWEDQKRVGSGIKIIVVGKQMGAQSVAPCMKYRVRNMSVCSVLLSTLSV